MGQRNDQLFQGKDPLAWKLTIKTYQHGGLNRTHDEQRGLNQANIIELTAVQWVGRKKSLEIHEIP